MRLVRWTTKSVSELVKAPTSQGHQIGETALRKRLHEMGYSLQANKKTIEGKFRQDRDAHFEHIKGKTHHFESTRDPVISVDCKKVE